jgi:hypothetical protein
VGIRGGEGAAVASRHTVGEEGKGRRWLDGDDARGGWDPGVGDLLLMTSTHDVAS